MPPRAVRRPGTLLGAHSLWYARTAAAAADAARAWAPSPAERTHVDVAAPLAFLGAEHPAAPLSVIIGARHSECVRPLARVARSLADR